MEVTAKSPPTRLVEATEYEIEKIQGSRFITTLTPASCVETVLEEQERLRRQHPHSRHVCYAFVGESELDTRFSDDGEPSKTAGLPMLKVLLGASMRNTGALVTRYFGGVKLGTGGLVRAYTRATRATLDQANTQVLIPHTQWLIQCDYSTEPRVRHELSELDARILASDYAASVKLTVELPSTLGEKLDDQVGLSSACRATLEKLGR